MSIIFPPLLPQFHISLFSSPKRPGFTFRLIRLLQSPGSDLSFLRVSLGKPAIVNYFFASFEMQMCPEASSEF